MRRIVIMAVLAAVMTAMLALSASPVMAFIHEYIPAGQCATSDLAGDNETAESKLPVVPIQTPPAPDTCPAPQK